MATLLLSAAGSALGGAMGGSFAGLGAAVIGKAVGATLGSALDQRLLGSGAEPVETGRVERFRVMGSSEGSPIARVYGRARLGGHLVWSSRFLETVNEEEVGGKGGGGASVREYSYSVSLAIALCEGPVLRVGRVWADGIVLDQSDIVMRLHKGGEDQQPDPLISAIEGTEAAPAYRGTAYVVFENLDLTQFGNRIPQFNFEVFRRPSEGQEAAARSPWLDITGVALVPGTGEYSLATEPVYRRREGGETEVVNIHNDFGRPDLAVSIDQLSDELPSVRSVSLVVSWFGDDLRCGRCTLRPAVEQTLEDGDPMPWRVSGQARSGAKVVSRLDDRPIFGGTPCDASVMQAIEHLRSLGQSVMFYPFILMDIQRGNGLTNPWTGNVGQPPVPWRGRITIGRAPGGPGSSDQTPAAAAEVDAFFGAAAPEDFTTTPTGVEYHGPEEWSYRRFILHYAHLCAASGGVDAFCIGSEMRSLTQVRDGRSSYPAVRALVRLADEVRAILGPRVKIGYAADWSEYFGHQPADGSGDVLYNLDPIWSHSNIDFIGIDNYMPLSDWRAGATHLDAAAGSIYDLGYLTQNVASGEGFDWYYADEAGRAEQTRIPIRDGAYGEDWVFRYKDLAGWWSNRHVNRQGGTRAAQPTAWVPRSKPIWFTELGCPAIDKGTNQPNVFYDPKSSESFFPYHSNGSQDEFIQYRYLQATYRYWNDSSNNPPSDRYAGRMVDMSRAHVWAWDARPWPDFPDRLETWSDGPNHDRGHWLNGRTCGSALAEVVSEITARAGLHPVVTDGLYGMVQGYAIEAIESGRQSLQPLMIAYAFDSFARDGSLTFATRGVGAATSISHSGCVHVDGKPVVASERAPAGESAGRVLVGFVRGKSDYQPGVAEARLPVADEPRSERVELAVVLSEAQAQAVASRMIAEAEAARDTVEVSLPPSWLRVVPGDMLRLTTGTYRVDRIEDTGHRQITAVRIEAELYEAPVLPAAAPARRLLAPSHPVSTLFLDLPLLRGDEDEASPHVAVSAKPWQGAAAIYASNQDSGYRFQRTVKRAAAVGALLDRLPHGQPGLWMPCTVRVRMAAGVLQTRSKEQVLNGANAAALRDRGDGDWEVVQFETAELVAPQVYALRGILRGQAGTDVQIEVERGPGTTFVLLDGAVEQLKFPPSARGLDRHYRVGPATRSYTHSSYTHIVASFRGIGLRPYRPVHISARRQSDGSIEVRWTRRTRIDGDSWAGLDVPLGEETEVYLVRVLRGGATLREATARASSWLYREEQQAQDGATGHLAFEIAQVSARFGPGQYGRIEFDV